jgi:cohesin complex subunit SCC1
MYLLRNTFAINLIILQAFRLSGNNDIPAGLHMPSRDALMLPDVLTEGDNLEMPPMPDASFLFSQMDDDSHLNRKRRAGSRDINLQDDLQGSQFLQNSIENRNLDEEELALDPMDDIDLGLDFGLDLDEMNVNGKNDRSIEIGRDAPVARAAEQDIFSDLDVQVPSKENFIRDDRDTTLNLDFGIDDGIHIPGDDGDVDMFDNIGDQPDVSALPARPMIDHRARVSESPLSDVDEDIVGQGERMNNTSVYEQLGDETEQSVHHPQRARKQKILQPDAQTELSNQQIKEQQLNRDKITKPQSFIPRNPELLALMEMQKNGDFIDNIMKGGRSREWAPELKDMLSFDAARKAGELKRKRDSGIADMNNEDQEGRNKSLRLDFGDDAVDVAAGLGDAGLGREETNQADGTMMEMPGDDGFMMGQEGEEHNATAGLVDSPGPNFDETTAPLVHPADSGPVSLGTKHAVHLLRDRFGPEAANSPDKRKKASVLFQDLLPEATTSKADATKMFFEVLVLATKDAVKVEQQEALLGAPIRVRGKRGLWGDWAEREAGGEIEDEANAGPNPGLERAPAVAVAA